MNQIDFGYAKGTKVLRGVSARMRAGQIAAIAGRNGSGKTTLTRVIMGLARPTGGTLHLAGKEVTAATPAEMAGSIGYVFQHPDRQLFANTVREEVAYAPRQLGFDEAETARCTASAIGAVGLGGMEEARPQMLPHGHKQRLAIASALAAKPKILILDEPTSGQDCRERTILLRLTRRLNRAGMTILLITHDMDIIAEHADQVIVLERGAVQFDGPPANLFGDEALTLRLGLELPEAVRIGKELGLGLCLTPTEIYRKMGGRRT